MNGKEEFVPLILLVDDEIQILNLFSSMLKSNGHTNLALLNDSRQVLPFLEKQKTLLVITDISMPFLTGNDLLSQIKQNFPEIPVIFITGINDLETAVECMKNGASDYLVKPVGKGRLVSSVEKVLEIISLKNEVSSLRHSLLSGKLQKKEAFSEIITADQKMHNIFQYIEAIADSPLPVLVTGETGVGKELIARAIHRCSSLRRDFVAVNVAGLDDTMFSDTLFGHRKGAFTGADFAREGLIQQAAGGTLFLDEIGDLTPQSQVRLLRLIQEKEYYPLGMDTAKKTDARIICATNRDVHTQVNEGHMRRDLYYRLSAHHIEIPALRARKEDIPLLLHHFLDDGAKKMNKKCPTPPPELLQWLSVYEFPGNIREFQSLIYDAVSRHQSGVLSLDSFKKVIADPQTVMGAEEEKRGIDDKPAIQLRGAFPTLKQTEDFLIEQALEKAGDNQGIAASMLGITRQALNRRLSRRKR